MYVPALSLALSLSTSLFSRPSTPSLFYCLRQVRARLVIDGSGLGLGLLRHLKVVTGITSLGKAYFPETTASASIVNAPWFFAKLYAVVSPLLTPLMRKKVKTRAM